MAKFPEIPIDNDGYWCNPKKCSKCSQWFDFCVCNSDCATKDVCEDCVACGKDHCHRCKWV